MRVIIEEDYERISQWVAYFIVNEIHKAAPTCDKPFVLGLPTGSSPMGTFKELIRLNREGTVSFQHVVTFNMDEYVGIPQNHPQSYHSFMMKNFFSSIDIKKENIHLLNGMALDLKKECADYERKIASYGGIDLFLGGIGSDGHIAFNEPFSSLNSLTRDKSLTYETKLHNSRFFDDDIDKVPLRALTVGVKTICDAQTVVLIVNGHAKAHALQGAVEGPITQMCTASALQQHKRALLVCDERACDELKVGTYRYFKDIECENLEPKLEK